MTLPRRRLTMVWDDRFNEYDLGPTHPFRMEYRGLAAHLVDAVHGTAPSGEFVRVRSVDPSTRAELARFHTPDYLEMVDRAGADDFAPPLDKGDTPAFPGCFPAAARIVAGTLTALAAARSGPGGRAMNPSGGLHHAHPDRASGFCVFNDVAVALRSALNGSSPVRRVAYIDIDAHHGDGVMYGFYRDGRVLDIDVHQDGRTIFPGTGRLDETGEGDGEGLKVNVPLPPGAGDEAVVPLIESIVPEMVRAFRPELVVLQHGMDAHAGDRLAQLQYTPWAYARILRTVLDLADEVAGGRLVITGGGGYLAENVALGLARAALTTRGRTSWDSAPPEAWRREFHATVGRAAPRTFVPETPTGPTPWSPERTDERLDELGRVLGRRFPSPG
ncbi:MAG: acetoin utilization protein AcuC [Thermoplasmata archaeon]